MGRFKDILGQRFGRLTVIERTNHRNNGRVYWLCRCDCGKDREAETLWLTTLYLG